MPDAPTRVPVLDRLAPGSRVCVIRLRSLGDCVLTTPALALLKSHRPDLRVTVVVEARFSGVFEHNPDIDEISSQPRKADLAINLHGGTRSMWMTRATRAKCRVGFAHHRYNFIYTDKIPTAQEILGVQRPVHTAEHLASAMFWLGVPQTDIPRAKLTGIAPSKSNYAVIHPFASAPEKAWPVDRFLEVGDHLQKNGLAPVIVAGPADDASPFARYEVLPNAPLTEVKNLMAGASLFIGNDSGPAHIAAAFGVPVVVIFGPSNPVTWAPWRTEAQVLTAPTGISEISTDSVLAAIERMKVKA
jgi:heptosyltransferase-3